MPIRKYFRKLFRIKKNSKLEPFLKIAFLLLAFFLLACSLIFVIIAKDLPRPEKFTEHQIFQSTKIYDRTGKVLLYEIYGEEKRTTVPLETIPEYLKQAVIATEDASFYNHFGIDPEGIFRSILINFRIKEPTYGGSTLDQQLIRSTFFSTEKTATRKIREIILALELDRRYAKDEILGWYLNQIPLGQNAYGMEAASQIYFSKAISDIDLTEAAVLTALIKSPYSLSPYGENVDKLLIRKDYVLERMFQEGYIDKEQMEKAKEKTVKFSTPTTIKAPHFVLYIIENYLKPKYGQDLEYLKENGVRVITSLDWDLQEEAEKQIKEGALKNRTYNANNAALVAIDPSNGEVLAMVGSADWFAEPYPEGCSPGLDCLIDPKFNAAIGTTKSIGRQPGSSFKPFVYAAAFENGYNDKTVVSDELTSFGIWGGKEYVPHNYDGLFRGAVTLRQALAMSLNVPAVKVLTGLCGPNVTESINNAVKMAENLGITTLKAPFGPSIVLGGWEVKLLDMVSAYGVFATEGLKALPVSILQIEDYSGNIVQKNNKSLKRVLSKETAQLINSILSDNNARTPMFGPRSHLYFEKYIVSAKTGTTDNFKDAWTIGYTPLIAVGVWAGNSNNESMIKNQPAATVAGPIFHNFIESALDKISETQG